MMLRHSLLPGHASDTEYGPLVGLLAFAVQRDEFHAVGMEGQEYFGFPDYFYRCCGLQCLGDGNIGHVSLAGSGEASVQGYLECGCFGMPFQEYLSCLARPHSVAAGWTGTDAVEFFD